MPSILIIEDDKNLSRGIAYSLEKEGFTVHCADTLSEGESIFNCHNSEVLPSAKPACGCHTSLGFNIDLVILDLNLPDGDGVDFCMSARKKSNVPILMLTARDLETDELTGLAAGADDYITKPFSVSILRARVENLLRRSNTSSKDIIQLGAFTLNTNSFKFYLNDTEIPISTTEFRLLKLFMNNVGKILPKEQITTALWENQDDYVDDNALSVNISRLRSKIEANPKKPTIIKTIHGIGYCLVSEISPSAKPAYAATDSTGFKKE